MRISVGDHYPAHTVLTPDERGTPKPLDLGKWFDGRTCVIFGGPGAFTSTCSRTHIPGFIERSGELRAKGVDAIAWHSVNDAFVMAAWAKDLGSPDITMIADGSGNLTEALGLQLDLTSAGMGLRCKRYASVIVNGKVGYLGVEEGLACSASSIEEVLEAL